MKKEEFLKRLEMLLSDISEEEREEAMEFYRGYFEDAGTEQEAAIIEELESPENVAETIKRDLGMVTVTEKTESSREEEKRQWEENPYGTYHGAVNDTEEQERKAKYTKVIWIVILLILTSPVWFGILTGAASTIFGVAVALIAVTAAFFVIGTAFAGLGIAMLIGISTSVFSIPAGLVFIGTGLLILAVSVLFMLLCKVVYGTFFPWVFHGIGTLCKKLFADFSEKATEKGRI